MITATLSCDVCLGPELQSYPAVSSCGRELLRCPQCGLVAARPGSPPVEPGEPVPREPRDDERRAAVVRRLLPTGRILEIGCGEGRFLAAFEPNLYVVAGLEASEQDAELARERLRAVGSRGGILSGDVATHRLPAESYDMVALFGYLARCASPRATLMEVSRVLRPGGHVVIETPSLASLTARLRGPRWQPLRDPTADYFFTRATLRRLAISCGFEPGVSRPAIPAGWPHPGILVYLARKAGQPVHLLEPLDVTEALPSITTPLGVTQ
jgi:SAM-dependent methyltransferase